MSRIFIISLSLFFFLFFFTDPATTEIYTLSLHDALPISPTQRYLQVRCTNWAISSTTSWPLPPATMRSEEHTSELQSHSDLVCRLLLEKKKLHISEYSTTYTPPSICSRNCR